MSSYLFFRSPWDEEDISDVVWDGPETWENMSGVEVATTFSTLVDSNMYFLLIFNDNLKY